MNFVVGVEDLICQPLVELAFSFELLCSLVGRQVAPRVRVFFFWRVFPCYLEGRRFFFSFSFRHRRYFSVACCSLALAWVLFSLDTLGVVPNDRLADCILDVLDVVLVKGGLITEKCWTASDRYCLLPWERLRAFFGLFLTLLATVEARDVVLVRFHQARASMSWGCSSV